MMKDERRVEKNIVEAVDLEYEEFKNRCGIILNEQQDVAVQTVDGPVLLLAVPGSGKTTVLVTRLAVMTYIKEIDPRSILTITYTVAATNDMKNRFIDKFGDEYAEDLEFRTINGICQKILSYFGRITGKKAYEVADKQTNDLVKMVFREVNDAYATENDIKNITTAISYVKNMRLTQPEIAKLDTGVEHFPDIYKKYNEDLKNRSLIDYDDQMVYALMILEKYPEVLSFFQDTYRYICVDEAQDTSKIQLDIINLLASKYNNLFMVGDEDQSIYGFRAAYPQGLLNFEKIHRNAKTLLMETNYRSNNVIVEKADEFIQKNQYRHAKHMNATRFNGGCVTNIRLHSRKEQYDYLLKVAFNCSQTTAVLYRNNESTIPLIDLFERNHIPYKLKKSDMMFFSHPIVVDIVEILKFAINPMDSDIFIKIYYKIGASIKKTYAQQMAEQNRGKKPVLLQAQDIEEIPYYIVKACRETYVKLNTIASDSAGHAIYKVLHELGYENYMIEHKMDSQKADILQLLADNCGSIRDLLDRLEELQQIIENGNGDSKAKLVLSTIHSSKGLEYDQVYLMDMTNDILPTNGKPRKNAKEAEKKLYEEERRLFYVAMTRAKNELYIFTYQNDDTSAFCVELFGVGKDEKYQTDNSKMVKSQNIGKRSIKQSTKRADNRYSSVNMDFYSQEEIEQKKMDYEIGVLVRHRLYGRGVVTDRKDDRVVILFDSGKQMIMKLDFVLKNGMLALLS